MRQAENHTTLEASLHLLQKEAAHRTLTYEEVVQLLLGRGRTLLLILLALPFCQPLQIPGFSTPFGIAIAFIGLRMVMGKRVWLPKKLLVKKISSETIKKFTTQALRLTKKVRFFVRPRLHFLTAGVTMMRINGLIICALGILLALPIPLPLSNLGAAWGIFLIAFGTLEDDGLFILIGYLTSLIWILLLVLVAFEIEIIIHNHF